MNLYKVKYEERKNKILDLLQRTKEFYVNTGKEYEGNIFDNLLESLKNEEFSIVLVGEFSAGKSTFLNALMGEKILPSFTNETTATVNFLRHKDRSENGEEGRVYLNDGQVKVLDKVNFDVINKYVCTNSDIGVANTVDHLDIYLNSRFLEGNVTLVDSPGLNGTADGHREITESQIEKSSASIFMFKADQPGSKTDFEFLRKLKNRVNTIIFVLNKIDDIKVSEGETTESVIQSLKNNYKKQFPEETTIPEIWGVSAYQALVARSEQKLDYRDRNDYTDEEKSILEEKSRMSQFEDRLWKFLTQGEKAKSILLSPVEKIISISKDLVDNAKNEVEVLACKEDSSEIEEKILEVKNQIEVINETINNSTRDIKNKFVTLTSEIEESFGAKAESIKNLQIRKLENWADLEELLDFEKTLVDRTEREFNKIVKKCEKEFIEGVNDIIEDNYRDIVHELNDSFNDTKFSIVIDPKYEPTDSDIKLGIEKYEEKIKELEDALDKKRYELNDKEVSRLKLRALEREKENLISSIENYKVMKQSYEDMTYQLPNKQYRDYMKNEKISRGGLFGGIGDFLFGKKNIQTVASECINEDEINNFKKEREKRISQYNDEINDLKAKLEKACKDCNGIEEVELVTKKIKRQEKEIQDKIIAMQQEYKENYIKKNKSALVKRKGELESYFEEITDEYSDAINKELKNKRDIFVEITKNIISNDLNSKLENKNNEYKLLENKLKSSQDEKEKYISELTELIKDANKLIEEAVYLQIDIESEEVNTIQEEVI